MDTKINNDKDLLVDDDQGACKKTSEEIVNKEKESKTAKKFKSRKKISKFAIIPLVILLIGTSVFTVKTGALTELISFFTDLVRGNNNLIVEGEVADYGTPARVVSGAGDSVEKGLLTIATVEDEQARLDAIAEDSRVYCIISSSPYFSSVEEKGSLFISNPKESKFITQVTIVTQDTEEEMYLSPILKPNEKVEYDYLTNKEFKKGSYKANALFNYYTIGETTEDGEPSYLYIGTMCAEITVVIS